MQEGPKSKWMKEPGPSGSRLLHKKAAQLCDELRGNEESHTSKDQKAKATA